MEIFKLFGSIFVDNEKANESISKTDTLGQKLGSGLSKIGGLALGAGKVIATGMAAGVTAMTGVVAKTLETTSVINKFADTCNVSTTEYQKLDGVMKTMGWSMEDAAGDFAALSEKMHEAATTGEGEAFEMFQRLGVETTNLDGSLRNTGDVFNDMVLSLQNVSNETERQAIASIMLGTTSEELAPLLKMTNEEFIAMKDNINVIDEEQLQKAEQFKQSWDTLKQTFETVVAEIGIALMPIFQTLFDWINEYMPEIQAIIEMVFGIVVEVIDSVVEVIQGLIEWFTNLLENNTEIGQMLIELWETIREMFETVFKEVQELISAFIEWATDFWNKYGDQIIAITTTLWGTVKTIFETAFNVLMEAINFFTAFFKGDFEGMSQAVTNICKSLWNGIKDLFNSGVDFIANLVPMMFEIGCNLFDSLWDGLKSVWDGIWGWISDCVDRMADALFFWRDSKSEMSSGSSGSSKGTRNAERIYSAETKAYYMLDQSRITNHNTTTNNTNNVSSTIVINTPVGNARELSRQLHKDVYKYQRALGVK